MCKGAVRVQGDDFVEGENARLRGGEEFLGFGVEVFAGGGEDDEFLTESSDEFADDVVEVVALGLDGEKDGNGVG